MNKSRPFRVYFRVNQEELDWLNEQVKASGDTRQNYLLHKVVTPSGSGGDTTHSEEKRCPKCGGRLVLKNGYRGRFWGCSNYPECTYSEDWKGDDSA